MPGSSCERTTDADILGVPQQRHLAAAPGSSHVPSSASRPWKSWSKRTDLPRSMSYGVM